MTRRWIPLVCLPVAAACAFVAFAQQDADTRLSDAGLAERAVAQAETLLAAGRSSDALVRYLAALRLAPDSIPAREGIERALLATPAPVGEREDRETTRLLDSRLRTLEQTIKSLTDRVSRLARDLDDDGAAEPITRRLEVELNDVERLVDRLDNDVDRLSRDLSRVERDVDRLRRQVR